MALFHLFIISWIICSLNESLWRHITDVAGRFVRSDARFRFAYCRHSLVKDVLDDLCQGTLVSLLTRLFFCKGRVGTTGAPIRRLLSEPATDIRTCCLVLSHLGLGILLASNLRMIQKDGLIVFKLLAFHLLCEVQWPVEAAALKILSRVFPDMRAEELIHISDLLTIHSYDIIRVTNAIHHDLLARQPSYIIRLIRRRDTDIERVLAWSLLIGIMWLLHLEEPVLHDVIKGVR